MIGEIAREKGSIGEIAREKGSRLPGTPVQIR